METGKWTPSHWPVLHSRLPFRFSICSLWSSLRFCLHPRAMPPALPSNGAACRTARSCWSRSNTRLPMVVVQIIVDAGARRDPRGKEGLAALTADLLTEGTKTRSASQISEATDFIGAALGTGADTDYASLGITAVSKDLDTALSLLTDVLLHPTFPEAEVARRREAALATMQASEDDPATWRSAPSSKRSSTTSRMGISPSAHPRPCAS